MSYNNLYSTPNYNSSNGSEATIINNYYNNNNKEMITVDTSSNYYINVTLNDLTKTYDFLVVNSKDMYLPIVNNNLFIGFTIRILNATGNTVNLYTHENQLMYSNLYIPKQGSINILLKQNSLSTFCVIKNKNTDLFSWIMI